MVGTLENPQPVDGRVWEKLLELNWKHIQHLENLRIAYGVSYGSIAGGLLVSLKAIYDARLPLFGVLGPQVVAIGHL